MKWCANTTRRGPLYQSSFPGAHQPYFVNPLNNLTEQAVDSSYDKDFKGMLQANQNSTADDDDLHVWPTKRKGKNVEAYWQFQPNTKVPGRYAIRYSQTRTAKQLSVCFVADASDQDTATRPCLLDASDDDTQQWDIAEWASNSTYRFVNVQNGTKFYMDCIPNGPVYMGPDIETKTYQSRQHWLMTSGMEVNDSAYSTIASGTSTGSSTTATGEGSSSTPDSAAASSSHKGLSSSAIAGISVGSVLGVTALSLAAFFLWRFNKRKSQPVNKTAGYGLQNDRAKSEMSSATPKTPEGMGKPRDIELPYDPIYAELPAEQRFELP
ncbi:hypothetical protein FSARC_12349 [Fusarium sarcochroum]|uniref:Ricin B lectin domain-containing protein n=1 Tax=Fusarium sarcochroum TaxID=1208366 RepID=A0A8H4T9B9_9HYPO|nr:hypothetical protein FSARC_12349 [Fusarium sarcochroum]